MIKKLFFFLLIVSTSVTAEIIEVSRVTYIAAVPYEKNEGNVIKKSIKYIFLAPKGEIHEIDKSDYIKSWTHTVVSNGKANTFRKLKYNLSNNSKYCHYTKLDDSFTIKISPLPENEFFVINKPHIIAVEKPDCYLIINDKAMIYRLHSSNLVRVESYVAADRRKCERLICSASPRKKLMISYDLKNRRETFSIARKEVVIDDIGNIKRSYWNEIPNTEAKSKPVKKSFSSRPAWKKNNHTNFGAPKNNTRNKVNFTKNDLY